MRRSSKKYVHIMPPVEGFFSWADRHTLFFKPAHSWDIGSRYVVTLDSGARSLWGKSLSKSYTETFEAIGAPYVRSVIPQTEDQTTFILPNQVLTLRFDRAMKSVSGDLLHIIPPVAGKYQWPSPNTLQFIPHAWPMATSFKVEIPVGMMADDGGLTETAVLVSLETPEPRILSVDPPAGTLVSVGRVIRLHFNQEMDLAAVQPGNNLQLFPSNDLDSHWRIRRDGFYNVEVTYGKDDLGKEDRSILVLTPTFPYRKDHDYRLVLKKDLKGLAATLGEAYGAKGLAATFEWRFRTAAR